MFISLTLVQALERTQYRSNLNTVRIAKLSSSDVELDGMVEVGYYVLVHYDIRRKTTRTFISTSMAIIYQYPFLLYLRQGNENIFQFRI